jgi:hypothetical protein
MRPLIADPNIHLVKIHLCFFFSLSSIRDFLTNFFCQNDDKDFLTPYFLPKVVFWMEAKYFFVKKKVSLQKNFQPKF